MSAQGKAVGIGGGPELRLAYIVLAHEGAEHVAATVELLLSADPTCSVVIHLDRQTPDAEFSRLKERLKGSERAHFVEDRVRSRWGQFGLVEGVVRALTVLDQRRIAYDYVLLLSGSCMPTKPLSVLKRFLSENRGWEFIEAHSSDWMKNGLRDERYQYRHWFSYPKHPVLFDINYRLQRALGLKRKLPNGLQARFGSQWWCLTREAVDAILEFCRERPRDYAFFRRCWIPDEMFFQTLVASLMGESRLYGHNLTYFEFTSKGRPVTFYDDHRDVVADLPGFFARKISPGATEVRKRLTEIAAQPDDGRPLPIVDKERAGFDYEWRKSRQLYNPRPGQLFYAGQAFNSWPSALAQSKVGYLVVHGPEPARRLVLDELKKAPGFTFLGRVFAPREVRLEAQSAAFDGFGPDDVQIRDMDPPLYLSRLLARAEGVPVIEVSPGDTPHGEGHFQFSERAVFISCQPPADAADEGRRLYWTLVALERSPRAIEHLAEVGEGADGAQFLDAVIGRFVPPEHVKWMNETVLSRQETVPSRDNAAAIIHLNWGDDAAAAVKSVARHAQDLRAKLGHRAEAVVRALSGAAAVMARTRAVDLARALPARCAEQFSAGAGETVESWAAVFDRSPLGYAVLYGPAAVTAQVRGELGRAGTLALLGRVFDPAGSNADPAKLRRDADRPLYLSRLLAEAGGFPVIEVSPGDEPVGERYFLSDPNAIVISCQPDMSRDLDRGLYWTLAALDRTDEARVVLEQAQAALEQGRMTGNRLQALAKALEFAAPVEHREWINRALADGGVGAQLVRISWRDPALTAGAAPSPTVLSCTYGPHVAPLEEALGDIRRAMAGLTIDRIAWGLPSLWKAYFCEGLEPAARRSEELTHITLCGPLSMTRLLAEALELSPDQPSVGDGGYVGSATSRKALAVSRSAAQQPARSGRIMGRIGDLRVIAASPAEAGHGSRAGDRNGVTLLCAPADPHDPLQWDAYWALVAADLPGAEIPAARRRAFEAMVTAEPTWPPGRLTLFWPVGVSEAPGRDRSTRYELALDALRQARGQALDELMGRLRGLQDRIADEARSPAGAPWPVSALAPAGRARPLITT